jgi:4-hydroxy-tetrahydrodipicolinate reductase
MVYSSNFSLGVYQFMKLAQEAARLFGRFAFYDSYIHEWHHSGKIDSPSGTAKRLAELMLPELSEKAAILTETCCRRIRRDELHVTSTRSGQIPGKHEVGFDSEYDSIQLKHSARGREGFAFGAVRAAEWISGRQGVYTMDEFMASIQDQGEG